MRSKILGTLTFTIIAACALAAVAKDPQSGYDIHDNCMAPPATSDLDACCRGGCQTLHGGAGVGDPGFNSCFAKCTGPQPAQPTQA